MPVWLEGGLIWYEDPHSLFLKQHRALEIACRYLDRNFPADRAHHKYGGRIGDDDNCWGTQLAVLAIGKAPPEALSSDPMVCVDKVTGQIDSVTHGQ